MRDPRRRDLKRKIEIGIRTGRWPRSWVSSSSASLRFPQLRNEANRPAFIIISIIFFATMWWYFSQQFSSHHLPQNILKTYNKFIPNLNFIIFRRNLKKFIECKFHENFMNCKMKIVNTSQNFDFGYKDKIYLSHIGFWDDNFTINFKSMVFKNIFF